MTPGRGTWRELWRFRELVRTLAARNLKLKYKRSALGVVWTLLNPLLTVGVLVAVFTQVVRLPVPGYWAFLLSGFFVWNFVQQMLASATYVVAEHGPLRRSVAFPAEVPLLAAAIARFVEFALELAVVLVALVIFHHERVPAAFLLLPVLFALQAAVSLALAFPVAALAVFYSDVEHALPAALMLLFYLSPVFYPLGLVPEGLRWLAYLNPLTGVLELYHAVLYDGIVPSVGLLAGTALYATALLIVGHDAFNRRKAVFAEIV